MIESWIDTIDHPNAARDMFAVYMLSRLVKENSPEIKVILTGTGADELFNGYVNAYFKAEDEIISREDVDKNLKKYFFRYAFTNIEGHKKIIKLRPGLKYKNIHDHISRIKKSITEDKIDALNLLNLFYVKTHLTGWELPVSDNMSMQFSLETRPPLLDKEVMECAFKTPGKFKYHQGTEKYILREAFKEEIPEYIYFRKKGPFSKQVTDYMSDNFLSNDSTQYQSIKEWINTDEIRELNPHEDADLLWRLIVLSKWVERWKNT